MAIEFWKQEPFQNFDSGTEKGNGAIVGTKPSRFAGLWDGDNYCGFPDGRDVGVVVGEVVEVGKVVGGKGAYVFQVYDCETIRTSDTRVAAVPDGPGDV